MGRPSWEHASPLGVSLSFYFSLEGMLSYRLYLPIERRCVRGSGVARWMTRFKLRSLKMAMRRAEPRRVGFHRGINSDRDCVRRRNKRAGLMR